MGSYQAMRRDRGGRRGRSWVEILIALVVSGTVLCLFVPVMSVGVDRAWGTTCRGHLGELFRATTVYLHPDRGGNRLPASEEEGPLWFEKLEPLVMGYEYGRARTRFTCPKAPAWQQGFTRDSLSFGWNELEFPIGSVADTVMVPQERLLLADSLGSADDPSGPRAHAVVTRQGELRLDARHRGEAHVLFLDGHVGPWTRSAAAEKWADWTLAPPRPPGETENSIAAVRWWHWVLVTLCCAGAYTAATVGVRRLQAYRAARAEELEARKEQEEQEERLRQEQARAQLRREQLRAVPSGPVEPVPQIAAMLHVGRRSFKVRPDRETLIGRGDDVDVRIVNHRTVSRHHAKIRPQACGYVLYDLGSRSGTFVRGEPIDSKVLGLRERICLGRDVELVFELRTATAASPTAPRAAPAPAPERSTPASAPTP